MTHALANTLDWLRAGHGEPCPGARQRLLPDHALGGRLPSRPPTERRRRSPTRASRRASTLRRAALAVDDARRGRSDRWSAPPCPYDRDGSPGAGIVLVEVAGGAPWPGPRRSSPPHLLATTRWGRPCTWRRHPGDRATSPHPADAAAPTPHPGATTWSPASNPRPIPDPGRATPRSAAAPGRRPRRGRRPGRRHRPRRGRPRSTRP